MSLTFVLGGARSGKTSYALREAWNHSGKRRVMVATAQAGDAEMAERIARHRAERGEAWITLEAPLLLAEAIGTLGPGDVAVVDCLTLWLTNHMLADADLAQKTAELTATLRSSPAALYVVSNEVGQGIVPDNALARRFRDEAGWMNQAMAAAADRAVMVVAGLPMVLKG